MSGYVQRAQSFDEALERIERLRAAGTLQELADCMEGKGCRWARPAA